MKKNVLVTGSSKGIGKAIAANLSNDYNVFLTARDENKLQETLKEINAKGYMVCDLSLEKDLAELGNFIEDNSIDILINNAGEYDYSPIEKTDYAKMSKIISTNLLASAYLCSVAVKNMKQNKWGKIINIGSISGVMGEPYASLYSASKAGLIGLTKSLALELAEYNITVNVINPGWVETQMALKSIEESGFSVEETLETVCQKRFVQPEEIAKLIEYLISDSAKGITGQSINICAGLSLGF